MLADAMLCDQELPDASVYSRGGMMWLRISFVVVSRLRARIASRVSCMLDSRSVKRSQVLDNPGSRP